MSKVQPLMELNITWGGIPGTSICPLHVFSCVEYVACHQAVSAAQMHLVGSTAPFEHRLLL